MTSLEGIILHAGAGSEGHLRAVGAVGLDVAQLAALPANVVRTVAAAPAATVAPAASATNVVYKGEHSLLWGGERRR